MNTDLSTRLRIYALFPIGTNVLATLNGVTFMARVTKHRPDTDGKPLFTVIDEDDDAFDCEAHQLEVDAPVEAASKLSPSALKDAAREANELGHVCDEDS